MILYGRFPRKESDMEAPLLQTPRYTKIAVVLHWLLALAFLAMLASGLTMEFVKLQPAFKFKLYQWHKSLGVIVLWLVAARLAWRVFHTAPELPPSIHGFERFAAHAGHWALYVFMFVMPLSGWLIVSSSSFGLPTIVFGLFEWPHVPGVASNDTVQGYAKLIHWWGAWIFMTLILGHVLAVIKHAVFEKENLLTRMWFGRS